MGTLRNIVEGVRDWSNESFPSQKLDFVETPYTKIGGQVRTDFNDLNTGLNSASWFTTPPIEIKKGQTIKWEASGYKKNTCMIATCNENGDNAIPVVISLQNPNSTDSYYRHAYTYTAIKDCYVTLAAYVGGQAAPKLYIAEPSKVIENTNQVIDIMNNHNVNTNLCCIFKKVVCIGDSYTKGLIKNPTTGILTDAPDYSWVEHMKKKTGNEWINRGISGATSTSWLTDSNGLAKVIEDGKAQAYIVGLGINDSKIVNGSPRIPVGTVEDIGTEAATYYGAMSKIVTSLAEISPNAVIFLNTCPWDVTGGDSQNPTRQVAHNEAVRNIVEHYKSTYNIHCLDLAGKYADLFEKSEFLRFMEGAHPTVIGHARIVNIMEYCLSDYMHDHSTAFIGVPWIEYDSVQ